jgi:exodeoxyribonuclease VII small subunit
MNKPHIDMENREMENKDFKLEEAFERLNSIIEELEKPDMGLEASLSLYQEGVRLLKSCSESIDKVEKEIMILNENGETDGI